MFISFKSNRNQKNVFVYKKHEYQLFLADIGIRTHKVEDIIFVGSLSDALPVPRKKLTFAVEEPLDSTVSKGTKKEKLETFQKNTERP